MKIGENKDCLHIHSHSHKANLRQTNHSTCHLGVLLVMGAQFLRISLKLGLACGARGLKYHACSNDHLQFVCMWHSCVGLILECNYLDKHDQE